MIFLGILQIDSKYRWGRPWSIIIDRLSEYLQICLCCLNGINVWCASCIIALFFHLLWILRSDDVLFGGKRMVTTSNNQQIHFPNTKISFLEADYIIVMQRNHSFKDANFKKIEEKPCSTCRSFFVSLHPWTYGSASLYVVYPVTEWKIQILVTKCHQNL